ncbi:hypothetical protein H0H92_002244 [Tricholoma furcatifolium]|nr:hypothetical protein H0H92_002244 [Tricholoma furcatifolium]
MVPLNFGVILYPGFQALDVFGPLDALNTLALISPHPLTLSIIASTLDPVSTKPPPSTAPAIAVSQSVVPTHTFANAPPLDVLLIPGGRGARDASIVQDAVEFTAHVYPSLKYLITVCTGSVIAARAGVLDHRRATSNKASWQWVIEQRKEVVWVPQARWVVDENVWSSSGISAGIDVMFAWIGEVYGEETAKGLAQRLEYERHTDASWDPFAELYARALVIRELLDNFFLYLDDASNAANARVCKKWSDAALDIIWKEVKDLHPLLSLLAPLEKIHENTLYKFKHLPKHSDWDRFERYGHRVRKLCYRPSKFNLHIDVFDDIVWTRTSQQVLPGMHTLEWHAPLLPCVVFMHKGVKELRLCLPVDNAQLPRAVEDVTARMTNLDELNLRFDSDASVVPFEPEIVRLIAGLPNLKGIILPAFSLTSKIAEAASRLQNLEWLCYSYGQYQGCGKPEDISNFKLSVLDGSFPSLTDLSVTLAYEKALNLLTNLSSSSQLTRLVIQSPTVEPASVFFYVTSAIADACPLLETLHLHHANVGIEAVIGDPVKERCISIRSLRPLFKCRNLYSFELRHDYPLDLRPAEMEEIAKSWHAMETLILNNEPLYQGPVDLTLDALVPFAHHCPGLLTLGMFLNTDATLVNPGSQTWMPVFKSLKTLSFGSSPIQEESPVALFLSRMCLPNTVIEGASDNCGLWEIGDHNALEAGNDKWKNVKTLLSLLMKVRMQERNEPQYLEIERQEISKALELKHKRAQLLEKELEELKVEMDDLKNKLSVSKPSGGDGVN